MKLYAIQRQSAWANLEDLKAAGAKSAAVGNDQMSDRLRWIRSYVVQERDGSIGTVCIYQADAEESIREHARRVGMPATDIRLVLDTIIVRPDPRNAQEPARSANQNEYT
jgi:hypothetical protein